MGKTVFELQSNKGEVLPAHKFGTHDVVVLKPNKDDLGSPALGQGVDSSITIAFDDVLEEGLNSPLGIEKVANEALNSKLLKVKDRNTKRDIRKELKMLSIEER
ncbi:hypothetical protein M8C21_029070 [Ambrosia artemisiifolia]|uniref:Uncharacterized protein n=1 Tax=Ambrosia artemisiifolia TaxID=4212 RepID=A0AAD5DAU8_AMBAR|nr:hypothetical protein M8C21_029070 [Ambrosia artemisiifolia]